MPRSVLGSKPASGIHCKSRLILWVGLFVIAASGAATGAPALCLYEGYSEDRLATYPLDQEQEFSLSFIHSVSLTPVTDIYRVSPTGIHQIAEIFETHGAGLPSFAGDIGATGWQHQDGRFILKMDRRFDRIQLRIQREYDNQLHIAGQDVVLADLNAAVLRLEPCMTKES